MKKVLILVAVVVSMFAVSKLVASTTGYLYGHGLSIESVPGTVVASISNAGALVATSIANSGAISAAGVTSSAAVVVTSASGITVSTSASTAYDCTDFGAVAVLPTSAAECSRVFLVTDHKLYVATSAVSAGLNGWVATH